MEKRDRKEEILTLTRKLVSIPSISDSDQEKLASDYIAGWFQDIAYFRENPQYTGRYPIPGDYRGRDVVYAFVPGSSSRTLVLMGHFDVVSAADYGEGARDAFDVDRAEAYLRGCEVDADTRRDLESGAWMFGRGSGDMKGGLAACMVFVKEYSSREERPGSLLLLAVPDEESYSAGMRGAGGFLKEWMERYGLEYQLLIDPEPNTRQGRRHIVPVGSAGKCMPVVLVQGVVSHVSRCFEGLNPMGIMGEIFRRTELSLEFSDESDGEISCPPTWLWMKDMKEEYDVSVPHRVSGYISIVNYGTTPEEILGKLIPICRESFAAYVEKMKGIYREYQKRSKYPSDYEIRWEPEVLTLAELMEHMREDRGEAFEEAYRALYRETADKVMGGELNYPQATIHMMDSLLTLSGITRPLVLLGFTPPYYPAVRSDHVKGKETVAARCLEAASRRMQERFGFSYVKENYTLGLSDLSYCSIDRVFDYGKYAQNTPLWGELYHIDFDVIERISMPSVMVGPWSKDLHKRTERIHIASLSEEYPELLEAISREAWRAER